MKPDWIKLSVDTPPLRQMVWVWVSSLNDWSEAQLKTDHQGHFFWADVFGGYFYDYNEVSHWAEADLEKPSE